MRQITLGANGVEKSLRSEGGRLVERVRKKRNGILRHGGSLSQRMDWFESRRGGIVRKIAAESKMPGLAAKSAAVPQTGTHPGATK